jgi:hypothetical protein
VLTAIGAVVVLFEVLPVKRDCRANLNFTPSASPA